MNNIPFSPNDGVLRFNLLSGDKLRQAEEECAGVVRVIAAGRYTARLRVGEEVWKFFLTDDPSVEFAASGGDANCDDLLRRLAFHRAAEVMLALRQGHKEAVLSRQQKKLAKEPA
ncbi:hypothetical protein HYS79_01165 [Patescibacteria group bacterium]|nr:hypothetical protein [Patescibacteria group bacterium]